MANKTQHHLWLEQRITQLGQAIALADNEAVKANQQRALRTLKGELIKEDEKYRAAQSVDDQINRRRSY